MSQPVMVMAGRLAFTWPFDAIIVTAAPPEIPIALIAQLAEGGIMVLPVGEDQQVLKRLRRQGEEVMEETIEPVRLSRWCRAIWPDPLRISSQLFHSTTYLMLLLSSLFIENADFIAPRRVSCWQIQ